MGAMQCCGHSPEKHQQCNICTDQIHYPSEDYPCLCDGLMRAADEVCSTCGHQSAKHVTTRRCTECGCFDAT